MEKQKPDHTIPQSPEGYPTAVREQLNQRGQSHDGPKQSSETAQPGTAQHMGAVESAVTPNKPPMEGPGNLVGKPKEQAPGDVDIDPEDELTPG